MFSFLNDTGVMLIGTMVGAAGLVLLVRNLSQFRSPWKTLETAHTLKGVDLTETRSAWQLRKEEWGSSFAKFQSGHMESMRADLAVLQKSKVDYAFSRVAMSLASAGLALMLIFMIGFMGMNVPSFLWLGVVALPALTGFSIVPSDLKGKAAQRREQVSFEFSQYLQLAAMFLFGARDWQSALRLAARTAKEPTFQAIGVFLERGAALNQTVSQVFEELGDFWQHDDIRRFANTAKTAEAGGSMRSAIVSQSKSISERNLHQLLEAADKATQKAAFPETGIVALYMMYLLYPSIAQL